MTPILSFLTSSGSKKNEPRYEYLSEVKASQAHKMLTEFSFVVTRFLQTGLFFSPITYKCLLMMLYRIRSPTTALDCVLLKDNNRALVARLGPEINSRACLCVLRGPRHNTKLSSRRFIFLLMIFLETPKKGSGPTNV